MNFGGRKNEDNVLRRFFHNFKKGVCRLFGEHMCFVYDIDAVFRNGRGEVRFGTKVADIVYVTVGSGVHLGDIEKGAVVYSAADLTFAAGFAVFFIRAVYRLRKNFCAGGFTDSSASGEKIGVAESFF